MDLRSADHRDAYVLWLWANDEATRAASLQPGTIPWDVHQAWFNRRLADRFSDIAIAEDEGKPVGVIRFESADEWRTARLSYAIAVEARGRGLGTLIVTQGMKRFCVGHPTCNVFADVRAANNRSLAVFRSQHWNEEMFSDDVHRFWRKGGAEND